MHRLQVRFQTRLFLWDEASHSQNTTLLHKWVNIEWFLDWHHLDEGWYVSWRYRYLNRNASLRFILEEVRAKYWLLRWQNQVKDLSYTHRANYNNLLACSKRVLTLSYLVMTLYWQFESISWVLICRNAMRWVILWESELWGWAHAKLFWDSHLYSSSQSLMSNNFHICI